MKSRQIAIIAPEKMNEVLFILFIERFHLRG